MPWAPGASGGSSLEFFSCSHNNSECCRVIDRKGGSKEGGSERGREEGKMAKRVHCVHSFTQA